MLSSIHRVGSFKTTSTKQFKKNKNKTKIRIHGHERDAKTEEDKLRSNTSSSSGQRVGWQRESTEIEKS